MAKVSTFCNFHEPLSAKGISNSGPVRWSKKHVNFSKVRIGKAYEVATGTGKPEGNLLVYWSDSFTHQLLLGKRVSDTKCYPGAAVLPWKTTQNSKGFLKRLSGHCYHPKRREVRLKSFSFFDLLCYRVQYQVPFTPTSHYVTKLTRQGHSAMLSLPLQHCQMVFLPPLWRKSISIAYWVTLRAERKCRVKVEWPLLIRNLLRFTILHILRWDIKRRLLSSKEASDYTQWFTYSEPCALKK